MSKSTDASNDPGHGSGCWRAFPATEGQILPISSTDTLEFAAFVS